MAAAFLTTFFQETPWGATAAAALLAVVGALVVHRLGQAVLLRASGRVPLLQAVVRASAAAAGAALPLAALQVVWTAAPDTLRWIGNVRHFNGLLLIAALTWLATRAIRGVALGVMQRHSVDAEDNLHARRVQTQATVLSRTAMVVVVIAGASMGLMTFPAARQLGASLLASAGVVGIVAGIAARPVFSNLIAGLQLALAQPIRLDDVLIVKGEWGRVAEITGTYVVMKLWDERQLIVPLQWFIENPFENWTRTSSQILGSVMLHLDYATPVEPLRQQAERVVRAAPEWDGRVFVVQVTDTTERAMQLRILVSAVNAAKAFDLRCRVREQMLAFVAREYPQYLPQVRSLAAEAQPQAGAAATRAAASAG